MAEKHIAKKVDKKPRRAKYFAQWGPKGFLTTPDKIVPFWGLKTTHEIKKAYLDKSEKEPKNVVQRNALKVTFNTRYLKASGTDPKDQMHQWYDLLGAKHPMYIGGQQFGSPLLQLEDVKWSNFIYAPDGEIIGADAEIHLIEWYEGIEIDQGWFNPEPESQGGVSGDLFNSGASNEIIIWNFCRAHGYSAAATAGIMGNMWQESRLKPDTNEIGGFGGYGLCQWTNTGSGDAARKTKLINWCKTNGYDYRTLEGQLNFMLWEHKNTSYYWNNLGENYKKLTDVWTATDRWLTYYEGCTVRTAVVNWPGRLEHAKIYYGKYSKYNQVPLPGQSGGVGTSGVATGKFGWMFAGGKGVLTQPLGPAYGGTSQYDYDHLGIDVSTGTGTIGSPVIAVDGGVVVITGGEDWSYGSSVVIDHKNGYFSRYAHLYRIDVKRGQTVKKGQQIGIEGVTGNITGLHVHFELRYGSANGQVLNPEKHLNRWG